MSESRRNPFQPTPPDEAKELSTLIRAIDFARRFSLLIVRCNEPITRDRLIQRIRESLPKLEIETVEFEKPIRNVLDELRVGLTSQPGAIFVTGLEHSIERDAPEKSPFIINLNHSRNGFGKFFNCPLVLWLPEFVVNAVAQGAPDFFSVRSGLYYFFATPDAARPAVKRHLSPEIFESFNLPLDEKRERIASIENLLSDFRALPEEKRDLSEEAELLRRLGVLYETIGELEKAKSQFLEAVRLAEISGNEGLRALCFGEVADILQVRGELDAALRIRRDEQLPAFEKLGDVRERAVTLGYIADILFARGEFDSALRIHQEEELPLYEKIGDIRARAITLRQIAGILFARGDLDAALRIQLEEVLPACEKLGDLHQRAVTLVQIAGILLARGDLDSALKIHQKETLPVYEKLGDVRSRAITLGQIAFILQVRGDLDEALRIQQEEELPVYEKLGDILARAFTLTKIGLIFQERADFPKARSFYEESLALFKKMRLPQVELVKKLLRGLDEAEKNAPSSPSPAV